MVPWISVAEWLLSIHAVLLGMLLIPLYWFWDRILARPPSTLALVLALTAYLLFTWGKVMLAIAKAIHNLPER
jgi:hypothetical protein